MRDSRGAGEAIASRSPRWTGLLASDPQLAAYDGDELFDSLRTAKEMEVGVRRIPGNRVPETRHALATIGENPAPEVGALRRSAQGAPGAAEEREVQQNNGICSTQPHLDGIMRAKIPIQDPAVFLNELLL